MGSSADLSGKVILVTGASRGIGHAVSLAAAQAGADELSPDARLVRLKNSMMQSRQAVPMPPLSNMI